MTRSAAIILSSKEEVALLERVRGGRRYYVFPGGGVAQGESPVEAMIREVWEELGLEVVCERLIARVVYFGEIQYYFLARVVGGRFGSGRGEEMLGRIPPERGTYRPVWLPLDRLKHVTGWPKPLFAVVADVPEKGWPDQPLRIIDRGISPDTGDSRAP